MTDPLRRESKTLRVWIDASDWEAVDELFNRASNEILAHEGEGWTLSEYRGDEDYIEITFERDDG